MKLESDQLFAGVIGGFLGAVIALAGTALARNKLATAKEPPSTVAGAVQKVVRAERFELVNGKGVVQGEWMDKGGWVSFEIFDEEHRNVASMTASGGMTSIAVMRQPKKDIQKHEVAMATSSDDAWFVIDNGDIPGKVFLRNEP